MFKNILNPNSGLMVTLAQITDCIFLSLFWLLCCVPVVTAGASFAALYDSVYRTFRKGQTHSWQLFFRSFGSNWKAGILPTAVFLVVFIAAGKGLIGIWNAAVYGSLSWAVFYAAAVAAVVVLGILSVLFPVLSRFDNSFGGLLKNTVLLALANLPRTFLVGAINAATLFLCVWYVYPAFVLPAVASLLSSFLIEPMFKPYLPDAENEE